MRKPLVYRYVAQGDRVRAHMAVLSIYTYIQMYTYDSNICVCVCVCKFLHSYNATTVPSLRYSAQRARVRAYMAVLPVCTYIYMYTYNL